MDVTSTSTELAANRKARTRSFVRHYFEMIAAMVVGMVVLHPVAMFLFPLLGWSSALSRPDLHVLVMATNMSIAMALWMRYRGAITATPLFVAGHLLMLPAMLGVMLLHPKEYSGHLRHGR